jgi:hypothetical protein
MTDRAAFQWRRDVKGARFARFRIAITCTGFYRHFPFTLKVTYLPKDVQTPPPLRE